MQTMFNLPQYKPVYYTLNPQSGYYTKSLQQPLKTPVMRLPYELRVTPTQLEKIKTNAKELIVSREKTKAGNYKFFTGIQQTNFKNWYLGNDFEKLNGLKVISIILFHFKNDNSELTVYYFSRFDKGNTSLRLAFANSIIPHLLNACIIETLKTDLIGL